jgi:uncharacterized Ntn-hydrolase superfamily protein
MRLLAALLLSCAATAAAQGRSADGVDVAPDGSPRYATFSIAAVEPSTGESAVAVTTRVPFVGRAVPWVRAGVGAVATQSWTAVEYGREGLDLLASGVEPRAAIEKLLAGDQSREKRQLGVIDMKGRSASFTGKENGAWAGSRQGTNYTVQGNILVGPEVVEAVAAHLDSTAGTSMPLAERLILALEAGQAKGGDRRWGSLQSAAIRVADPNDPGRGGDHVSLAIEVGEHADPVAEMKRIYYRTARRLGHRAFSEVRGPDVAELKRMLQAVGYWRKDEPPVPPLPVFRVDRAVLKTDPARYMALNEAFNAELAAFDERYGLYDAEARDAVDRFRKDHGLEHEGNPRGLVDERLVSALRERYFASRKADAGKR